MKENRDISPKDSLAIVAEEILEPYRLKYLASVDRLLPQLASQSQLRTACSYALKIGGKRLRPAIVYMISEALSKGGDVELPALVVEFFHVSSLICDDLPCMDDDDFRRGEPTTHRVFSEATALLASFGLTAAGFELLTKGRNDEAILRLAVSEASMAIGLSGLIGGQQFDLHPEDLFKGKSHKEAILDIIDMKTGSLFMLSFLFGWMYGGGEKSRLEEVRLVARSFGRAFQILDDIDDYQQDVAAGKQINYAVTLGLAEAKRTVLENLEFFREGAICLGFVHSPLLRLTKAMESLVTS
jgi:geranylgeranyl diphosphate synthase, type II